MSAPQLEVVAFVEDREVLHVAVTTGPHTLGRSPGCDLVISADLVSRQHARLTVSEGGDLILEDLGSSNGTFLDDQPVVGPTAVLPNQSIRIGTARIQVRQCGASARPAAEELSGQSRYEVGAEIAKGGMGSILAARQPAIRREVAMKVMLGAGTADDHQRFIAEAQVTGQLEHPNIVPVHDLACDEQGKPYYTMKLVRGITLKKVLQLLADGVDSTTKKYPLASLLTIFQKVCDAVAFAHSRGIIHRDLKPENIMLGDYGEVLVMDWGLAKVLSSRGRHGDPAQPHLPRPVAVATPSLGHSADLSHTLVGTVLGTPAYMSPEQARGEVDDLDARSDIYALGSILFHILFLKAPYGGKAPMQIVEKVRRGQIDWPAKPPPGIPDSLLAVTRKAMALAREERYATVETLQADLTAYQNGFATSAEKAGLGKHLLLGIKRHRAVAASIAAAVIIIATLVVGFTIKVIGERNRASAERDRAERALANLQKAVPTLIAEGRKLIDAQQFEEALSKITFAVEIEPTHAGHRLLRAHLLQAMLKLDESIVELRHVLELPAEATIKDSAEANLALCEKLNHDFPNPDAFNRPAWQMLYSQMEKEGRATQAVPVALKLGRALNVAEALLKARWEEWRQLPGWSEKLESERIKWESDGSLNLDLGKVLIDDLTSLKGLPVSALHLGETRVTNLEPLRGLRLRVFETYRLPKLADISPLKGMPLEVFLCETGTFEDLSPLAGAKLRKLRVTSKGLRDFSVARGMPIEDLFLATTSIGNLDDFAGAPVVNLNAQLCPELTDISAVRTMKKLRNAEFGNCPRVKDLSPLLDCPSLQVVGAPRDDASLEVLRKHPNIREIGFFNSPRQPVDEFWAAYDARRKLRDDESLARENIRVAFATAGQPAVNNKDIVRLSDGTFRINLTPLRQKLNKIPDLHGLPISTIEMTEPHIPSFSPLIGLPLKSLVCYLPPAIDLAPLAQCPQLELLHLSGNPAIRDLSPLATLKLQTLLIYSSGVADLSPLARMPLRRLVCHKSKVSDLTPLKSCTTLTTLEADDNPALRDLSPVAGLPIQILSISGTAVTDLTSLASMPLRDLRISRTKITDIRPLLANRDLESLLLPTDVSNIGDLRTLPKLRRLSFRWDESIGAPAESASEFWKSYDTSLKKP